MTRDLFVPFRLGLTALAALGLCLLADPRPASADVLTSAPPATDLGTPGRSAAATASFNAPPLAVSWFSFTIPEVSNASGLFLDVDTAGSLRTINDTIIALYDSAGNFVAFNDDGGPGNLSALSFGCSSPARTGFDFPLVGQDGSLLAGTYYLAICGFNPSTHFGLTGWDVTNNAGDRGLTFVNVRLGPPAPTADAGPDQSAPELTSVTLDASASRGVDLCDPAPPTLVWTQIAGPPATLALADPFHPTFIAPEVTAGGATLTFQLDVSSCQGPTATDFVNVTVTNVNRAPVAEAGPDQMVNEGSPVALDGSHSYDVDDDVLTYTWSQVSGPAVTLSSTSVASPTFTAPMVGPIGATLTFNLTVSDGLLASSDTVTITVENVNHPPVANAGHDATVTEFHLVTLSAAGSSDPDGDPLTYSWHQVSGVPVFLFGANTATPIFLAPDENHTLVFRVTVSDGLLSSTDDVSINVAEYYAPPSCITARPSDDSLWPPNHKLVPITINGLEGCQTGTITVTILGVTQDEPIRGTGSGDTGPDAVIQGSTVLLRAERKDTGNGRVYRISYQASGPGGTCFGTVKVTVPHDQAHTNVIDNGQNFNSVGP